MKFPFFGKKWRNAADDGPEVSIIRRENMLLDAEYEEKLNAQIEDSRRRLAEILHSDR
jgi:hypothetical protein